MTCVVGIDGLMTHHRFHLQHKFLLLQMGMVSNSDASETSQESEGRPESRNRITQCRPTITSSVWHGYDVINNFRSGT